MCNSDTLPSRLVKLRSNLTILLSVVTRALDKCWVGNDVTKFSEVSPKDVKEFVDNLDIKSHERIREYISDLPTLYYESKYIDSKGKEKTIKLSSLMDFFAFA